MGTLWTSIYHTLLNLETSPDKFNQRTIAHLSAEDMLKSAVIAEKKFKHSPWEGADNPFIGQNFVVNNKAQSLWSFATSLKKMSLKSDFIRFFFMILDMYIVPGMGQTAPRGQNFDVNKKALSLYQFVVSFKEISLKFDFTQFFHDLIYVYSLRAGGMQPPWGQNIDFNSNVLSFHSFVEGFKQCL